MRSIAGSDEAPCRFLLGARREVLPPPSEFSPEEIGWVDLDTVATETVGKDVRDYLARLLRASEPYATGPAAAYVDLIAEIAAPRLVRREHEGRAWGPFLLAGMFAHYLVTLPNPPGNAIDAEAHAERATGDLPQILERVLDTRAAEFPLLRPLLAVLARSRGDGMPLTVLRRCLAVVVASGPGGVSEEDCQRTLREASPYLRTGIEPTTRVALYRLFHQGLADYLRRFPHSKKTPLGEGEEERAVERALLDGLLAPQTGEAADGEPADRGDSWAEAEPYLLSHALAHVWAAGSVEWAERLLTEPRFLVRFDLDEDARALELVRSPEAQECLRLLGMSWHAHARFGSAADRAARLAFDAYRLHLPAWRVEFGQLAESLTPRDGARALPLSWATGGTEDHSFRQLTIAGGGSAQCAAFSPDGAVFAAGTFDAVLFWETDAWQPVARWDLRGDGRCNSVAFSPDGRRLAAGTAGSSGPGGVLLWDVAGEERQAEQLTGHGQGAVLAFSADGGLLATGGADHTVTLWDLTGDEPSHVVELLPEDHVEGLSFHPEEPVLAVAGHAGVRLYDTRSWEPRAEGEEPGIVFSGWVNAVGFSPDGRHLVIVDSDGDTVVLSTDGYEPVHEVAQPYQSISGAVGFTSDGTRMAVACEDTIQICAVERGAVTATLHGHTAGINDVVFSPRDPLLLVSVADDETVRLWRVTDREAPGERRLLLEPRRVASSPTAGRVAVLDGEGELSLLDLDGGGRLGSVPLGTRANPWQVGFSPDGETLAAYTNDGGLHLVRSAGGQPVVTRLENEDRAFPVTEIHPLFGGPEDKFCFSSDSSLIALQVCERAEDLVWAITVWDIRGLRQVGRIALPERADSFEFAGPDRLAVVVGGVLAVFEVPA
ncbi:hypothetical protein FH609_021020 [Streptomyces sp. 3MP-14]|uniref:Uncharacterized protein n=1 Tax=Streptomyces mimosae TaxID=2586635 RepID=A0A5N6A5S8_9ACTN|nr:MULTISPECIES: WD40 repeat domain-containing protein [Streptomyces]KAB8163286.1 hypothetical protein FH607_018435 [Streptomyces mimosae]KAB8174563.1 hypothetical protein FH609_021020 [Streptomyces sp. 3MP-14]